MRPLLVLIGLILKAKLRRSLRGAFTLKGAMFLSLAMIVVALWVTPNIFLAHAQQRDPARTQAIFPILLLGMCLSNLVTSAGERAVAFSPAEVDLLFAAPFTRRQLLVYKITLGAVAAFTASLLFSVIFLRFAHFWLAGFLGVFLSFMLLQLLSMAVVLIGQTIGQSAYLRGRKVAGWVVLVILAAALPLLLRASDRSFFGLAATLRQSLPARILLAPFDVFGHVIAAPTLWPDMIKWAGIAGLILWGLFLLVMWLDVHYLEVSAAAGQRLYARIKRSRQAGGAALHTTGGARLRLPMPPRMGGAGPIAWRQLTTALRQSRSLLVLLLLICIGGGPALYAGGVRPESGVHLVGIAFWLTMMLANTLRFDFRGDVDQIDALKALPVAPLWVAAAQLVAPTAVMLVLQMALLGGLSVFFELSAAHVIATILLLIPFNLMLFAVENIIFLLFPARYAAGPGDLQGFGRQMVVFMLKLIALTGAAGVAAALGALVYSFTGSQAAGFTTGGLAMWIEVAAIIPGLVKAYLRFDPSMDTPA
jgi:hypothetical protein